ncbi:hypothetical protein C9I98_08215 [Photobacterium sanctipauli]|uniref:PEP-CTERM sorting domain-containing protein n=1 Tax=Photobacterium sanctipauli TaxID=1342794 RepID=A0A2T3NX68_9GAMM|nr:VPLPA-CTERM sorting domain-containing protein [Photobacterium sanctipauli]PSW20812.1 hypothetical protein C9I98_08215 [Photobacterium sanctipauli]
MNKCTKVLAASLFLAPVVASADVIDYMVITTGDQFLMSDSEIGAIGVNNSTSPPGSLPALPGGTARTVSQGITLDGDAALIGNDFFNFSNSDVHSADTGVGSQGIDCGSGFGTCNDGNSNSRFNSTAGTASFSNLANNNGVHTNIDHSGLVTELDNFFTQISGAAATGTTINLSDGQVNNQSNAIWDYSNDGINGLTYIDIVTNDNDFSITNSNLTIVGDADDILVFRVENNQAMLASQSNLLLDGDIGDNNVLFFVDDDSSSFGFNNVTFQGMSMWDIGSSDNEAVFNNVQFCGQVITDKINFQNVSGSNCAIDFTEPTPPVSAPASIWVMFGGLAGLGIARRKMKKA